MEGGFLLVLSLPILAVALIGIIYSVRKGKKLKWLFWYLLVCAISYLYFFSNLTLFPK
jgi:energy-converting hydrogenase Eha subunit H